MWWPSSDGTVPSAASPDCSNPAALPEAVSDLRTSARAELRQCSTSCECDMLAQLAGCCAGSDCRAPTSGCVPLTTVRAAETLSAGCAESLQISGAACGAARGGDAWGLALGREEAVASYRGLPAVPRGATSSLGPRCAKSWYLHLRASRGQEHVTTTLERARCGSGVLPGSLRTPCDAEHGLFGSTSPD